MNHGSNLTLLPEDILLVDKPAGITSFDVIRILRKKLGIRKMGHAGTLDPRATGLMIIGVGPGTKKLHELTKLDKTYKVEVLLGKQTTTGDLDGEVIKEMYVSDMSLENIIEAADKLIGTLTLPVPAYSAIKQQGKPLYKKAREGEEIDLPVREMRVYDARVHDVACEDGKCVVMMDMDVASGVYVRSVAEELGRALGVPATVRSLRRTQIGEFSVEDAESIDANLFS